MALKPSKSTPQELDLQSQVSTYTNMAANNEFGGGLQVLADAHELGRATSRTRKHGVRWADPRAAYNKMRADRYMLYARAEARGIPKKEVDAAIIRGSHVNAPRNTEALNQGFSYAADRYDTFHAQAFHAWNMLRDLNSTNASVAAPLVSSDAPPAASESDAPDAYSSDGENYFLGSKVINKTPPGFLDHVLKGANLDPNNKDGVTVKVSKDDSAGIASKFSMLGPDGQAQDGSVSIKSRVVPLTTLKAGSAPVYAVEHTAVYTSGNTASKKKYRWLTAISDKVVVNNADGTYTVATGPTSTERKIAASSTATKL